MCVSDYCITVYGDHLVTHGDGVKDISFSVENCRALFEVGQSVQSLFSVSLIEGAILTVLTVAYTTVPHSSDSSHGSRTTLAPRATAFYNFKMTQRITTEQTDRPQIVLCSFRQKMRYL